MCSQRSPQHTPVQTKERWPVKVNKARTDIGQQHSCGACNGLKHFCCSLKSATQEPSGGLALGSPIAVAKGGAEGGDFSSRQLCQSASRQPLVPTPSRLCSRTALPSVHCLASSLFLFCHLPVAKHFWEPHVGDAAALFAGTGSHCCC